MEAETVAGASRVLHRQRGLADLVKASVGLQYRGYQTSEGLQVFAGGAEAADPCNSGKFVYVRLLTGMGLSSLGRDSPLLCHTVAHLIHPVPRLQPPQNPPLLVVDRDTNLLPPHLRDLIV